MEYNDELERMKNRKKTAQSKRSKIEYDEDEEKVKPVHKKQGSQRNIRKRRKKRKSIVRIVLIIFVLFVAFFLYQKFKPVDKNWTIAVFGLDARDGSVGKGALSDVIMVCNIDRNTGEIKIVSVFRDTYMKIDQENTYHKINQAYHRGGAKQAIYALEENLDLKIDDYVSLNWKAVVDAINILGGVDLEVTQSEFGYINGFITETVNTTGVGSVHLTSSGMQHLDGVQAVAYSRLRLMDTDYSRTERQRKVIGLAMEKAKKADFAALNNILVTVMPQVSTSIGLDDMISLAQNVKKYSIAESSGFPFARAAVDIGKKDCVVPLTLESNVVQLHELLYGEQNYQVSSKVKAISERIAKDSGRSEVGKNASDGIPKGNVQSNQPASSEPSTTSPPPIETIDEIMTEPTTTVEETTVEETEETTTVKETSPSPTIDPEEPIGPGNPGPGATVAPTQAPSNEPGEKPTLEEPIGPGNPGPGVVED